MTTPNPLTEQAAADFRDDSHRQYVREKEAIAKKLDLNDLDYEERAFLAMCQEIYRNDTGGPATPFETFFCNIVSLTSHRCPLDPSDLDEYWGYFKNEHKNMLKHAPRFTNALCTPPAPHRIGRKITPEEFIKRWFNEERRGFAEVLDIARKMHQHYPNLVNATEYPAEFLNDLKGDNDYEPNGFDLSDDFITDPEGLRQEALENYAEALPESANV